MEAAYYVFTDLTEIFPMSLSTIKRQIIAGRFPGPIDKPGKKIWPRSVIDTYRDALDRGAPEDQATIDAEQSILTPSKADAPGNQLSDFKSAIDGLKVTNIARDVATEVQRASIPRFDAVDRGLGDIGRDVRAMRAEMSKLTLARSDSEVEAIELNDWSTITHVRMVLDPFREISPGAPDPNLQSIELQNADHNSGELSIMKLFVSDDIKEMLDRMPAKEAAIEAIRLIGKVTDVARGARS